MVKVIDARLESSELDIILTAAVCGFSKALALLDELLNP